MKRALLLSLLLLFTAPAVLLPGVAEAQQNKFTQTLSQAWTWMEAGALDRADQAFKEVMADPEGRLLAEAHFGLAAVWWQKRNALASYQRLVEAKQTSSQMGWDAGEDGMWDRRIDSRIEYVQRNFTVIKLRAPSKAGVPPLADPRPNDPLLREFADIERPVEEALAEDSLIQWMILPNGTYWVGARLETLGGGELDPSRAEEWVLDKGAAARNTYKSRSEAIQAGGSPAKDFLAAGGDDTDPSSRDTRSVVSVTQRAFGVALQGGLAPTRALSGLDPAVAPNWSVGVQLEGRLALPVPTLALSVSGGWKTLPVNGCRVAPTRGQLVSLGVGPSLTLPLATNTSLGLDVAVRGGLMFGGRNDSSRLACVDKALESEDATGVARGGLGSDGEVTSSFALADLGWRGRAGALGAELAIGPVLDGGGPVAFSVQLHLGYDHLIPILPSDAPETLYLRDPRTGAVGALTKAQAASAGSMGRAQIGLRLRALF